MVKEKISEKKISPKIAGMVFGGFFLSGIIIIGILIYVFGMNNFLTRMIAKIIPYPAAFCEGKIVTVGKLGEEILATRKFYENQDFSSLGIRVDFNTPQGEKRLKIKEKGILNKLIENQIIENEAKKRGINISAKEVSDSVSEEMKKYGSENSVKSDLARIYGWNIADFEKNIVEPDLYKEKLALNVRKNDEENKKAKEKIEAALSDLSQGKNFEDTVQKYSEGESAQNGGDLGWFGQFQMLPEIYQAVSSLNRGERTEIVESNLGFHIIRVNDINTENGEKKLELSQIFVKTKNLPDWLREKEKDLKVWVFMKDFYWDNTTGRLEFRDKNLKNFEDNLDKNSSGDISVLF